MLNLFDWQSPAENDGFQKVKSLKQFSKGRPKCIWARNFALETLFSTGWNGNQPISSVDLEFRWEALTSCFGGLSHLSARLL
jgi:hypothetical protein